MARLLLMAKYFAHQWMLGVCSMSCLLWIKLRLNLNATDETYGSLTRTKAMSFIMLSHCKIPFLICLSQWVCIVYRIILTKIFKKSSLKITSSIFSLKGHRITEKPHYFCHVVSEESKKAVTCQLLACICASTWIAEIIAANKTYVKHMPLKS